MNAIPSTIDPVALLQELGLSVQEERGDEIYARCPGHIKTVGRIDHDASWSVNIETGEHYCFSCGYGGTIWWLIAERFEWVDGSGSYDIKRAEKWVSKRAGVSLDMVAKLKRTASSYVKTAKRKSMDESRLALFSEPPAQALEDRGISAVVAKDYRILWAEDYQAFVLPIRDPRTAKLWGWQLKGHGLDNHVFRNQPVGVKKSETLFGYEHAYDDTAILVESPLDVARLASCGFEGAVSSFGAVWTDVQLGLICERSERLVVALDNDDAGRRAALRLMGFTSAGKRIKDAKDWSRRIEMSFFHYTTDDKDVGDMEFSVIERGFREARSSIRGAKAVLDF